MKRRGLRSPQAESIAAQRDFDGVPERSDSQELDLSTQNEAHLFEATPVRTVGLN